MRQSCFSLMVAVAVVTASAVSSRADVTVWFELVSSDANVTSLGAGPGQTLVLSDPNENGKFSVTARMMANITDVSVYSAITTFSSDFPVAVTAAAPVPPQDGIDVVPSGTGVYGPGLIAENYGGAAFFGPGYLGSNIDLGTLTFSIDPNQSAYQFGVIEARVGDLLWAQSDFQNAQVRFGSGSFADGGTVGAGLAPVIQFIPEPTVATLLLMGIAPVLFHRRRSA